MGRRGPRHGARGGMPTRRQYASVDEPLPPPPPVEEHTPVKGPSPGLVTMAWQYTQEQQLQRMQRENGCDPSREDSYRLQGVQLIDTVREALQLPIKTFTTACTYYHKFRLSFRNAEYNYQDAALSALFVACKVEDTIKKSKEVLCAAYNLKNADKPAAPDDKIFERSSGIIVGLDRLILQTVGFDFRVRHPQKLLVKLIRRVIPADDARAFLAVAYPMSLDLYKTFAPIKQTSFTMALAVLELTALVRGQHVDIVRALDPAAYHSSRGCIVETLLDLLDLYTQFNKATKVGPRFPLDRLIEIKIGINVEVDADPHLHRTDSWCDACAAAYRDAQPTSPQVATPSGSQPTGHAVSPTGSGSGSGPSFGAMKRTETTMRFVFSDEAMRHEKAEVARYFADEYEEVEVEVDEAVPASGPGPTSHRGHVSSHNGSHNNSYNMNPRGHGSRRPHHNGRNAPGSNGSAGNGNTSTGEGGWGGPYSRGRNSEHPRHKSRRGGYYQ